MDKDNNFNFNLISLGIGISIGVGILYLFIHAWPLFILAGAGYCIHKGLPEPSNDDEKAKESS